MRIVALTPGLSVISAVYFFHEGLGMSMLEGKSIVDLALDRADFKVIADDGRVYLGDPVYFKLGRVVDPSEAKAKLDELGILVADDETRVVRWVRRLARIKILPMRRKL